MTCVFFLLFTLTVDCRDTTRYCEKVKQLKLCQLAQFRSRCCGTCKKAWQLIKTQWPIWKPTFALARRCGKKKSCFIGLWWPCELIYFSAVWPLKRTWQRCPPFLLEDKIQWIADWHISRAALGKGLYFVSQGHGAPILLVVSWTVRIAQPRKGYWINKGTKGFAGTPNVWVVIRWTYLDVHVFLICVMFQSNFFYCAVSVISTMEHRALHTDAHYRKI